MKIFTLIILPLVTILVFSLESFAYEKVKLQLRWHHGFQFAGYYMAREKGFYRNEGLDLEFYEGGTDINQYNYVQNGQAQFGVSSSDLIIEYLKGRPFRSLGVIFQHSPYALMVRKASGYNNPQQLAGKKIYIALIPRTAEIQAMFLQEGVVLEQLKLINPLTTGPDYKNPGIDAFSVYITNEPYLMKQAGIPIHLIRPVNYGIDFYGDCLFTSNDYIKKNPQAVERFKKASLQGWDYAFQHHQETIKTVWEKYNSDKRSLSHINYEYEKMRELILPDHIPLGQQNPSRWERIAKTYVSLGMAPDLKSTIDFIYDPVMAREKKLEQFQIYALAGIALLGTAFGLFLIWTWSLKHQIKVNESNQLMDVVLKNTHMMAVLFDPQFNFIWANQAYADFRGHDPSFFSGKNLFKLYPQDEIQAIFKNVADTGKPFFVAAKAFEYPDRPERGISYWDWSLIPVKNTSGKVTGLVLTMAEVTEQIKSKNKLQEREKQFRSLIETTKAVAWELNLETLRFNYISPRVYDLTGYESCMWEGFEFWAQILHPDDRDRIVNFCKTETAKGRDHEFEYRMITAHGKTIWIRDMCTIFMEDDKPILLRGFYLDITESKHSEEALHRSRATLEAALESMTEAVFISDVNGRFIEFNNAFATFHRFKNKKDCFDVLDLDKWPEFLDVFLPDGSLVPLDMWVVSRALRGETCINEEYTLRRKDTGETWIGSYNYAPIYDKEGMIAGSVVVGSDITERKKMEARIQQSQKMEAIGNLAGGIAHDFNNILCPIVGMSEMLVEDLPQNSQEYNNALTILKAGERGSELVKQILAFSRQSEHKMIEVRVQQILKEVLKLIRATIPSFIKLNQDIQSDCGPIMADPTQIHQIAMNIITNAFHAVESKGGEITVQLKEVELAADDLQTGFLKEGWYACLSITDTGHGIASEHMNKIFDPYFTTKEQGKGTGLGLAIAYGIVKEHKGDIKVYSETGNGTIFKIYLPLIEKPINTDTIEQAEIFPQGNEHILIVDDEKPIVKLEKQILMRLGYHVTEFMSSPDALKAFKTNPHSFDLVISDMNMPDITGDRLAEELKSIRPEIPVIICTGFSQRINKEKADVIGIRGILTKPIRKSQIAQMVRKVLDESKGTAQG